MIEKDLREQLESVTSIPAFPFQIPESATLPALLYAGITDTRHSQSNQAKTNLKRRIFQVTVVTKDSLKTVELGNQIVEFFTDFSGDMGDTKVLSCIINNAHDVFNPKLKTYEKIIDLNFTIKRG